MRKYVIICAAMAVALSVASCKSSESAYKKAYEKAQAAESGKASNTESTVQTTIQEVPVVQETVVVPPPVQQTTPVETTVVPAATTSDVTIRQENVTLVSGSNLKAYSVIVGSFGVQANAERQMKELKANGHNACIVSSGTLYRVVADSFDNKDEAINSRNRLAGSYQGAWLLYKK